MDLLKIIRHDLYCKISNTGNDYAEHVYIIDTLDSDLEIGTFLCYLPVIMYYTSIIGTNIVKFDFPYIYLPDSGTNLQGSVGYVKYSVRQKPNLNIGTVIKKQCRHLFRL